jgi:ferredoxin
MDGRYRVIDSLCMGCGTCREICFYGAVELLRDEKKGAPFVEIL